ncbi:hypothetical protein PM082_001267 [Marasmius tenuissimus]|nr:hypothetical protein PM082_001267 [Marasmius tenuissimus]
MASNTNTRSRKDPLTINTADLDLLVTESPPNSASTLFDMASNYQSSKIHKSSVLGCLTPLDGKQISPEMRAVADLLATMKSTVNALGKTFRLVGKQTEELAGLAPAIKASEDIKEIRERLEQQMKLYDAQIETLRRDLQERVKDDIRERLRDAAVSAMHDEIQRKVSERVGRLLLERLPGELRDQVKGHKRQILEIKTNIHNMEARRMNSCLKSSADTLYPLVPPVRGDISSTDSPDDSATAVESPAQKFPDNLGKLWSLSPTDLEALLLEHGVDIMKASPQVPPTPGLVADVPREASINLFLAHIGVPFRLVPSPSGQPLVARIDKP